VEYAARSSKALLHPFRVNWHQHIAVYLLDAGVVIEFAHQRFVIMAEGTLALGVMRCLPPSRVTRSIAPIHGHCERREERWIAKIAAANSEACGRLAVVIPQKLARVFFSPVCIGRWRANCRREKVPRQEPLGSLGFSRITIGGMSFQLGSQRFRKYQSTRCCWKL